ncbi:MAG: Acetyltransferase GNAT family [Candidatus Tokpelaia hoelldobleri]|uniref:Acetyltransferase GNAT family n=1 Tax=Candidatus Tokpelaia hoelldobleri TaxID=1902579 RepID=A0A1U9JSR7_9HYPH|nr:MAG: Acetyltransferase GNAT family [Candidatus Tokpelaia hoelldoblerii]
MNNRGIENTGRKQIDCPVLVTERLVLRIPHVEDIDTIAELANNPRVSAMLSSILHPYTYEDAADFVAKAAAGELGYCTYAVTLAETGAFIGCCSIHERKAGEGVEIGYWLGEPFWGQGYATEAISALIDTAFRTTDIDVLYAACFTTNAVSRHVLEKAGFNPHCDVEMRLQASGTVAGQEFALARHDWLARFASQMAEAAVSAAVNE